jgi:multiple sugar transport system permease protein
VFKYFPLVRGMQIAFLDYKVVGESTFVGLDNFIEVFNQDTFWWGIVRTLWYLTLALGLGFFAPIFLAIMLDEIPKGNVFFRIVYYLPAVMTGLVVAFLWKWVFSPDSTGLLNTILGFFGIGASLWLNDPRLAMLCVVIPGIWAGVGPGCLIYLAALRSVPEEIYEAADIDGASPIQKIFHITLPHLKAIIIINFVGAFIGAFQASQNIFVMTGGGPANATRVLGLEIWLSAFAYLKFGYATAVAWVMGAVLILFTVGRLRVLKRMRFGTARK